MQTQNTKTVTITPQGVTAAESGAENITFYLIDDLDNYCQSQQLDSWCWAASAVSVQNYYAGLKTKHLSTQADVCVVNKGGVVNQSGNPSDVLVNNLNYGYVDYAQKNAVNSSTLLTFVSSAITERNAMILVDGTSGAETSHSLVVLGYGQSSSGSTITYYLVYFDPYLGYAFPGSYPANTFVYAPFDNFLPDLSSGVDKLYKYTPTGVYMTPLLNAIPNDGTWTYPSWKVVNGKCDTRYTIPTKIVSGGVTYCIEGDSSCGSGSKDLYYYPRLTVDEDPLALNVYYASSVRIKRKNHSYVEWLEYGKVYDDPHENVIVTDTSYDENLGAERDDFYLYLIPMSKSLLPTK